jgi:hypothetical protein
MPHSGSSLQMVESAEFEARHAHFEHTDFGSETRASMRTKISSRSCTSAVGVGAKAARSLDCGYKVRACNITSAPPSAAARSNFLNVRCEIMPRRGARPIPHRAVPLSPYQHECT